jgi:xanthine dehydrogenase YagR molybdenum-binding subunit
MLFGRTKNLAGKYEDPEPRSMKRGNKLVGYGMATGIWDANRILGTCGGIYDSGWKS